jgi:hypothetical protein
MGRSDAFVVARARSGQSCMAQILRVTRLSLLGRCCLGLKIKVAVLIFKVNSAANNIFERHKKNRAWRASNR